jgi:dUTP pyrophosphatase
MKIRVSLLSKDAKSPSYANPGDAGLDLYSPKRVVISARGKVIIDTKVAIELPKNTVALVWDKGSLGCVKGIKVLGGVFDEIFRGSYTIGLANLTNKDYTVEKGDKIAQLLIQPIYYVEVERVAKVNQNTPRKGKKFGSTGKK